MSQMAYNKDIPLGGEETRLITFTIPLALSGVPIVGVDSKTGNNFFNLSTINSIIRAIEDQLQTVVPQYEYAIERDGYLIRTLYSYLVKPESPGPVFPGFPLNLRPGQYQIRMIQTVGTLAARNLSLVFQKALV